MISSAPARIDSMSTHWNGTIAHAISVASSAVQYGTFAPIASTMRSYSWKAIAATISATSNNAIGLRDQIRAIAAAPRTTPLRSRVIGGLESWDLGLVEEPRRKDSPYSCRHWWSDAAEAAVAFLVREHAFEQVLAAEVGPQRIGDPDLRVRDLP